MIDDLHGGLDRDQVAIVGSVNGVVASGNTATLDTEKDDFIQLKQGIGNTFEAIDLQPATNVVLQSMQFTLDSSLNGDIEQLGIQGLGGNAQLQVLDGEFAAKNIVLDGGSGNDIIDGEFGNDKLYGGLG